LLELTAIKRAPKSREASIQKVGDSGVGVIAGVAFSISA